MSGQGLGAAIVACAALTGCLHADDATKERSVQNPPAQKPQQAPADVLGAFVESKDARAMWSLLSRPTQRRFGTFARFRQTRAHELEEVVAPLSLVDHVVVLEARITREWAVAALAGERVVAGKRAHFAYAAALRTDGRAWRIELTDRIRIQPLRPEPGERVLKRTQIAAQVDAPRPIVEAGLWLDGRPLPGRAGGTSPRSQTMFAESGPLAPGAHSAVAFASAGDSAAALVWTFRAGAASDVDDA